MYVATYFVTDSLRNNTLMNLATSIRLRLLYYRLLPSITYAYNGCETNKIVKGN